MLDGIITCCGAHTDASTSIAFGTPCGHASRSAQAHLATVKKLRLCSLHLLEVALKLGLRHLGRSGRVDNLRFRLRRNDIHRTSILVGQRERLDHLRVGRRSWSVCALEFQAQKNGKRPTCGTVQSELRCKASHALTLPIFWNTLSCSTSGSSSFERKTPISGSRRR